MTYWQRLKEHPGVPYAGAMTLLGLIAGLRNPNFDGWVYPLVVRPSARCSGYLCCSQT